MAVNVPGIGRVPTTPAEKQAGQKQFVSKIIPPSKPAASQPMSTIKTPTAPAKKSSGGGGGGGGGSSPAPPQPMSTIETPTPTASIPSAQPTSVNVPGIGNVPTGGASGSVNDLLPKAAGGDAGSAISPNVVTGPQGPISLQQEATTRSSLFGIGEPGFGAVGQSIKSAFNVGVIGTQGLGAYKEAVFSPFDNLNVGVYPKDPTLGGGLFTTSKTEGLSMPEFAYSSRFLAGESPDTIRLTPRAAASRQSEIIGAGLNEKFNLQLESGMKNISGNLQTEIDLGKITVPEAEAIYNIQLDKSVQGLSSQYEQEYKTAFDTSFKEFSVKRARSETSVGLMSEPFKYGKQAEFFVETAALTAASATPIGAAGVSGLFLGLGTKDISSGILGMDIKQFGKGVLEAGGGVIGARAVLGPQEGIIKLGATEIKAPSNMLERQFQRQQLLGLQKEKFEFTALGKPESIELGGMQTNFIGGKTFGGARQTAGMQVRTFDLGDNLFSVAGKGTSRTQIETIFGKLDFPKQEFKFGSTFPAKVSQDIPIIEGTPQFNIQSGKTSDVAFGQFSLTEKGGGTKFSRLFSVSSETETGTQIIGGRMKAVGFTRQPELKFTADFGKGIYAEQPIKITKIKGGISSYGVIPRDIEIGAAENFRTVIQKGARTVSMKGFEYPKIYQDLPSVKNTFLPGKGGVNTISILKSPTNIQAFSSTSLASEISAPRIVGGTGEFSLFAGMGSYEVTEGSGVLSPPKVTGGYFEGGRIKPDDVGQVQLFDISILKGSGKFGGLQLDNLGMNKPGVKPKQFPSYFSGSPTKSEVAQSPFVSQYQSPAFRQEYSPIKPVKPQPNIFPTPDFDFGFKSTFKKPRFDFNIPGIGIPEGTSRRRTGKRKLSRTPSLIAVELGIKAPRMSKSEFTGLSIRPILTGSRRKRRK